MNLDITRTRMPVGKYRDQPISSLPAPYIYWFLCTDALRRKYQAVARAMLTELRMRLDDPARVEEMLAAPPVASLREQAAAAAKRAQARKLAVLDPYDGSDLV